MSIEENISLTRALGDTSKFGKPEGFSSHVSASLADNIIIRQNNTIIALLLGINKNLEKLLKEKEQTSTNSNIEELINKLNNIEITPQKERQKIIKRPQKWTEIIVYFVFLLVTFLLRLDQNIK